MSLFRPTYTCKKTGELLESRVWWYEFIYAGKRIRESSKSTRKTVAQEAEKRRRRELERALTGAPIEKPGDRIRSVAEFLKSYVEAYGITHRPSAVAYVKSCAKNVDRLLGTVLLPDLTEDRIRKYMATRQSEGASGRTINAELGELSRAIGRPWSYLWPRVRKLEERRDVGQALSPEEEERLLNAADQNRSPNVKTMVRVSLLTGLRAGELCDLIWGRIDFRNRIITVGDSKTEAGRGRQVPMNEDLYQVLCAHARWFTERFGETRSEYFVFPWGSPFPSDPTRPSVELKTAWDSIRKAAKVQCRWHDLRHTVCTKMAEDGVPESTMLAIMGHMSRKMLERYSHIRMAAKRQAVEALRLKPRSSSKSDGVLQESLQVAIPPTIQ
jgi:integrase